MSSQNDPHRSVSMMRKLSMPALALGLAVGGFGIASAAGGSGSSTAAGGTSDPVAAQTSTTPAPAQAAAGATAAPAADPQHPWGGQRPDETALTGDTATRVREAALAKTGGGTVERVETDADGRAAYEAHIVKDGALITVFVDEQFTVTGVEQR